jgi:UDP-N-acetylglucosamine/UDP-N-acetylgalactosamine diphosphorylase
MATPDASNLPSRSDLEERYRKAGQHHVFNHYDQLSILEQEELLNQLRSVPIDKVDDLFRTAAAAIGIHSNSTQTSEEDNGDAADTAENDPASESGIEPFGGAIYRVLTSSSNGSKDVDKEYELMVRYRARGLRAVAAGRVAAVVLAGGQGTRLGFDGPKGLYDIGLPSHKTLFQLMAERIRKLQELASASAVASTASSSSYAASSVIPFYVMTSPLNHAATVRHFEDHEYFGLDSDNVFFFRQGVLPCLDVQGKILMESRGRIAVAPDGNGGIYPSLQSSGALDDMIKRGVTCMNVFSVDNALVRPADPVFVGYCLEHDADVGNKVVRKLHPHEAVGVLACKNPGRRPCVVEYSEITKDMAEHVDPNTNQLAYGAANIANHYFTVDFVRNQVLGNMQDLYHAARKKVPYYDLETQTMIGTPEEPNGIKLEAFIFDAFLLSQNMAVLEVLREDEFAPVKNATGQDSPESARRLVSQLAQRWVVHAGATLVDAAAAGNAGPSAGGKSAADQELRLCEIVPSTSYAGEGLEAIVRDKGGVLVCPFLL